MQEKLEKKIIVLWISPWAPLIWRGSQNNTIGSSGPANSGINFSFCEFLINLASIQICGKVYSRPQTSMVITHLGITFELNGFQRTISQWLWCGIFVFFSLLVPSKWEKNILSLSQLVCLSLYIFWGKCVYFSIFEW